MIAMYLFCAGVLLISLALWVLVNFGAFIGSLGVGLLVLASFIFLEENV